MVLIKRPRARCELFEIRNLVPDRIYECWAHNNREAWRMARHRVWASSRGNQGLRRILQMVKGEQWPQVIEEAGYIETERQQQARAGDLERHRQDDAPQLAQLRAEREAAEEATHAARMVALRADQADRQLRRDALYARLGRNPPIRTIPTQCPDTREWI